MKPWHKLAVSGASALVIATALGGWFEGTRLHAYADVGGVWTICRGHTEGVKQGEVATPEQCRKYLNVDMRRAMDGVERCIDKPMTPAQAAAFGDLAYNVGTGAFCRSSVARKFNRGDVAGACDALLLYVHADGKVLPGLVKRRHAERGLCLQ